MARIPGCNSVASLGSSVSDVYKEGEEPFPAVSAVKEFSGWQFV
jgi:hypothetical protein